MGSRPFRRAFLKRLRDAGGWSRIFERIADGDTLVKLGQDLTCSRSWLHHLICDNPERKVLYDMARRESAGAMAELAMQDAETVVADRDEINKAKLKIEQRRYLASVYDREQFGEQVKTAPIQVNIGQLHLDALLRRALPPPPPVAALLAPVEADIVEGP